MKTLLSILGFVGVPVGIYLLVCTARCAVTPWAWFWLVCFIVFDLGFLWGGTNPPRARIALSIGAVLLVLGVGLRLTSARPTPSGMLIRLPTGAPGPISGRLFEEADLAMLGFTVLSDFGVVRGNEHAVAAPLLRSAYRRMRADTDFEPIPSPLVPGMFGKGRSATSLALVFNPPPAGERAQRAVILLHGIGGALKIECYLLARQMTDAMVVCPTVGISADWAVEEGSAVFAQALEYTEQRTVVTYVVGMSAGANGLQELLSRRALGHIAGAVMVSGYNEARFDALRASDIPILMLRGALDARTPRFDLHGQLGHTDHIRNEEIEGAGHYVFLERESEVLDQIDEFCAAH